MLTPGSRLDAYEIIAVLGEGGMGVVYRAHDLRLNRDVAIKTLKTAGPEHSEPSHRILQEARRAARLSHANVCTIYEVLDVDGMACIVMELVPGRALASMIPTGGLPAESVAAYGAQIADAIGHAHERGVLHRDIKSLNVIVTPAGQIKVLDFGLAAPTPAATGAATTETLTPGGPAGTLAYMAPEVIQGQPADERSDLWSLGIVLYEMAAGQLPFRGATTFEAAAMILREPLPALPAHVPPSLRAVIQRCLVRPADERFRHAGEVRAALQTVKDAFIGSAPEAVVDMVSPEVIRGQARRSPGAWIAVAAAALVALAAMATYNFWREAPVQVSGQRAVALFGGSHRQSTLSPDGAFVAFVSADGPVPQVWVKNLAGGDPIQITTGDVPASHPSWSPDNDQIMFARRREGIWSVPPLGGPARRLIESGENPRFSGNGDRLVFERNGREIWTANADGSNQIRVTGVPDPWYRLGLQPALSPDGSSIVYFLQELGPNGDLWIVASAGGRPRRLTHDLTEASDPIWTPDGRFIIFSSLRGGSRTLWRVRSDGGEPEPLTIGAGDDVEPSISRDGRTLIYTNFDNEWTLVTADLATGERRDLVKRRTELLWPRFSPDGTKIAFFGRGQFGDVQIYVVSSDGAEVRQLTQGRGQINTMPRWAADGARIFFYQNRPADAFFSMPTAGGVPNEVAKWPWETHTGAEPSPDGRELLYLQTAGPQDRTLANATVIHTVATSEARQLPQALTLARWSPDGRLIAGHTTDGSPVITVCSVDGSSCRALTPGRAPAWAQGGARLYFLRNTVNPLLKDLWSMTPDGGDLRKLLDGIGPLRPIDVTFDVSASNRIVFAQIRQGRHELWQAELR